MAPIIAIVGRPNVGKSTLFNRILGWRKAIVHNEPGVTRDRVYGTALWAGRFITLVDTGGLNPSGEHGLLGLVQAQAQTAIAEADAVVCLFDGRQGLLPVDEEIARILRKAKKPVFYAVNKADTKDLEGLVRDFYPLGTDRIFSISAETGIGVYELMEDVLKAVRTRGEPNDRPGDIRARISIVGRPNVGKSTLLNRLIGEERALVHEAPGTTRDALDTLFQRKGRTYLLIDTAGIRRKARVRENLEFYGVRRAFQAIERSDISLLLIDALEGPTSQELTLASHILGMKKPCILLVNKWDAVQKKGVRKKALLDSLRERHQSIPYLPIFFISALTGEGVEGIFPCVDSVMGEYTKRISTGPLNKAIQEAVRRTPPPSFGGKAVRLYYAAQVSASPPTIVVFTNEPRGVPTDYRRYLEASLRKKFSFTGSPVEIIVRKKT